MKRAVGHDEQCWPVGPALAAGVPNPARECGARGTRHTRRATVLLMIVGLLAMLFMLVSAFIVLARFERKTVQMVGQADQVTHILDSITDVAAAAVRGPRDPNGHYLVSGASYADIPGSGSPSDSSWGSPWLASAEPIRNPGTSYVGALPGDYVNPSVTSFSGGPATSRTINGLSQDADHTGDTYIQPGSNPVTPDTQAAARQPFTDANGDGVPDSSFGGLSGLFGGVGMLTELANAMGGRAVHATGIDPSDLTTDLPATNLLRWQQYDSAARYAVAANIISHGGMVQVSAPTNQPYWNTTFTQMMFAWIRKESSGTPTLNDLQAMGAQSAAVEPLLRRRGGLLAGSRSNVPEAIPPALWALQQPSAFPYTFIPGYPNSYWQRFNLASLNDWDTWRQAASLDAMAYNTGVPTDPLPAYARRQLLTTVNNSDELARIEDPNSAVTSGLGLHPGQLKFYLGRITNTLTGAFDAYGRYEPTRGPALVAELKRYYLEMLAAYDGWPDVSGGGVGVTEAVKRSEQAAMLAVNTVAFAIPRVVITPAMPGFIDNVWFLDGDKMYVGYAPQPYISQVMAYKKHDAMNPGNNNTALAVELYNPTDADPAGTQYYDLYLPQFALSVNDQYESGFDPVNLGILTTTGGSGGGAGRGTNFPERLAGRTYLTVAINSTGNNTYFDTNPSNGSPRPVIDTLPVTAVAGKINVKLWRWGFSGPGWTLVDQFTISDPDDGPPEGDPNYDTWPGALVDAWRDSSPEQYWGPDSLGYEARWRCTIAVPPDKSDSAESLYKDYVNNSAEPANVSDPAAPCGETDLRIELDSAAPSCASATLFAPCVPLYTMNAALVLNALDGAPRPASFPTVGFLLFVPRFSHVGMWNQSSSGGWLWQPTVPPAQPSLRPASLVLYEQWDAKRSTASYSISTYPADFGHMPVFDNVQAVYGAGSGKPDDFASTKTGRVPWGQLVFDYFTTLDPNDPNNPIDPYRVPGRININDASWFVLAGLPVIGPDPTISNCLPLKGDSGGGPTASPAFWSTQSRILAGVDRNNASRFPWLVTGGIQYEPSTGWHRLGPYLAQAAAAYRDRIPYVATEPFLDASLRNAADVLHQYRPTYYGDSTGSTYGGIRGAGDIKKRGFLTLGELANMKGFDGSDGSLMPYSGGLGSGPDATVLGGYGLGVGGDFMKAVSLLALLDTHFLTTRSNTFTVYTTLYDRENPQASVRSQMTVDRSNLLPRLVTTGTTATTLQNDGSPEVIARRDYSYFNSQYDQ